MIYLDNNATTQTDPAVIDAMLPWLGNLYGNPSAGYRFGRKAHLAIEEARAKVAGLIDADAAEIVFTSGGTESNNLAVASALHTWPDRKHILTGSTEHSAIYEACRHHEANGYLVTMVGSDSGGSPDMDQWKEALEKHPTVMATLLWANNETGVLSPIAEAADACKRHGVFFHSDAVQAVGKIPVSVNEAPIHSLAMSAHKFHGPKGIGALYINRHTRFTPMVFGGGQENERRSGTENVAAIVGMGVAADLARMRIEEGTRQMAVLRDRFEELIVGSVPDVEINGRIDRRLPNTSNLFFPGIDGEGLLILLDEAGVCCSPGSACSTGSVQPSRVLKAMGHSSARARSSVRFSLSHLTTGHEIEEAAAKIVEAVGKLRVVMPSKGGVRTRK